MSKVLVVGGGASGMSAAIWAARRGHRVSLYEKNDRLGRKLFITGKGRCNITNACDDIEVLFQSVISNPKFLYSGFYGFTNQDAIAFFEELGVGTKVERGDRVFPVSDHSSDVIRGMEKELKHLEVEIHLQTRVRAIESKEGKFFRICLEDGHMVEGDACIVATGGLSYPNTGSTGDGLKFAKELDLQTTECMPALVPMTTEESWVPSLQGLSLRNVNVQIFDKKKKLYDEFGEMLFTHYGVSGPLILSASSYVGKKLKDHSLKMFIDLKPALSEDQLDRRLLREFEENKNKQFHNSIGGLFPSKLVPVMLELSGIDPYKKVNVILKEERQKFVYLIKHLEVTLTGLRDYNEAIITKGGIKVKEIDPKTMEAKKVAGLYFVGEVLDLDALTGGFNLQIAWSTAYAAGISIP